MRFGTYRPAPDQPTQAAAVAALEAFVARVPNGDQTRRRWFRKAPAPPEGRLGIYLDGGFGVGKTHLLSSLWHAASVPEPEKVFCTFVELTHVVGALGFGAASQRLSAARLVCIDEFELDDPGDTVLVSTLLSRLTEAGVQLAATSNTLLSGPPSSGLGGPDDRGRRGGQVTLDDFGELCAHLGTIHPSRYDPLLDGVDRVLLADVLTVDDQTTALRLVVLADRLYDRAIPVAASGAPLDRLFAPDLLTGGYRKKYFRAISRLVALADAPG